MMAPSSRLLLLTALLLVPAAAFFTAWPAARTAAGAVLLVVGCVAVVDGIRAGRGLRGAAVRLPELTRLTKDREGVLELQMSKEEAGTATWRVGLVWPREIESPQGEELLVTVPGGAGMSLVQVPCVGRQRGRFSIERCYVQAASPWGLWHRRRCFPVRAELRVYPDLRTEHRRMAALFLHRGAAGFHRLRQVGKGREFEKLRDYIAGDPVEEIHWKATAKRGRPVTKTFQIERTQEVYVVVDASRLSARVSGGVPMLERSVNAALMLALAASQQSDLFGLVTFSDKVEQFVRAKNGKAHYDTCRDALYTLQPRIVAPDFAELFSFIATRLRRRALLIVLTALDDPVLAETFVGHINLLARQHLLLVNMLAPAGAQPLFRGEEPGSVDEIYRRLGGQILWHDLQEVRKKLQRHGVQFSLLPSDRMVVETVGQYLRVKQRQLL